MAFHADVGVVGGYLAVSGFFALSGYLLTSLLVAELTSSGSIDVAGFYRRRVRRLAPAALATLSLVALGVLLGAPGSDGLSTDLAAAVAHVANWRFVSTGQEYSQIFSDPSPVAHFWSLAIEEQFAFALPVVVVTASWLWQRRPSRRTSEVHRASPGQGLALVFGAGAICSLALMFAAGNHDWAHARWYYGTDTRAAELLVGAAAGAWAGGLGRARSNSRWGPDLLAAAALLGSIAAWMSIDLGAPVARWALIGTACAAVIVVRTITADGSPLGALLDREPLVWVGERSYGIYLIHWPVIAWVNESSTGLDQPGIEFAALQLVRLAVVGTLAEASHRWLEQPVLTSGRRWGTRPLLGRYVMAASCTLVLALLVGSLSGAPAPHTIALAGSATTAPPPVLPPTEPPSAPAPRAVPDSATGVEQIEILPPPSVDRGTPVPSGVGSTGSVTPVTLGAPSGPSSAAELLPEANDAPSAGGSFASQASGLQSGHAVPIPVATGSGSVSPAQVGADRAAAPPEPAVSNPPAPATLAAAPAGPVRLMLAGDSLAFSLAIGLVDWARADGNRVAIWNVARYGCGISTEGILDLAGGPRPPEAHCFEGAAARADALERFRPEVVLVVAGPWDLVPRQLDGSDHWLTPGASDFEAWLSVAYAERLDQYEAAGARVAWTTAPCSEERLAASPLFESVATTRAALDVQHRVLDELAAARPDVLTVVDLDAEICPGGEYTSRIGPHPEGRPDGLHFSVEAAESLGDWLIPRVTGITD